MHSAIQGDCVSAAPTAGSHERRRARRGHQSGQHAGEERGAVAVALGKVVAHAGESAAHFEHAGEIEAHREQQIHQQSDEQRRLQLKAPAQLLRRRRAA